LHGRQRLQPSRALALRRLDHPPRARLASPPLLAALARHRLRLAHLHPPRLAAPRFRFRFRFRFRRPLRNPRLPPQLLRGRSLRPMGRPPPPRIGWVIPRLPTKLCPSTAVISPGGGVPGELCSLGWGGGVSGELCSL